MEYAWDRLLNINVDSEPLITEEWIPKERLQKIVKSEYIQQLGLNDKDGKSLQKWASSVINSSHSSISVEYVKSDRRGIIASMEAGVYVGSVFVGRSFARKVGGKKDAFRVQSLPRVIRNTLYHDTYYDIDIKNSHPSILAQLFDHLPIHCFKEYAISRDQLVKDIVNLSRAYDEEVEGEGVYVFNASVIKKIVGSIINNCDSDKLGLFGENYRYLDVARQVPIFRRMIEERDFIYAELRQKYHGFVKMVDAHKGKHSIASSVSILLQDVEDEIIRVAYESLLQMDGVKKTPFVMFLFDGFLYPKSCIPDIDSALKLMSESVEYELDLKIEFAAKPMLPIIQGCETEEMVPEPTETVPCGEDYAVWKKRFEENHYRLENPCVYVRVGPSGTQYFNQSKFATDVCAMEDKGHVKEWISDPLKRKYECEVFSPPPQVVEPYSFNTYNGLRAESLEPILEDDVEDLIKPILFHVKILGGDDMRCNDYLLKWMATRVQKPGFLPKVVIGIRSVEGTGKDSFFNFFGTKILGKQYFTQAPDLSSLYSDRHCMALKDKLLVVVSECSRSDANSVKNRFKSFITAEKVKFRPLYVEEMTRDNFAGFVLFSQDHSFISIDSDDRRFATMDASAYLANDPTYFNKLHKAFGDDRVARAFYQHLMQIDLEGFEISRDRPMTHRRISLINSTVKPVLEFIKDWCETTWARNNQPGVVVDLDIAYIKKVDLWIEYKDYVDREFSSMTKDFGLKSRFYAEMSQLVADTRTPTEHAVQLIKYRGDLKYKFDLKKTLAYVNKLTVSNDYQIAVEDDD